MSAAVRKPCRLRGTSRRKSSHSEQRTRLFTPVVCVGREESIRKPGDFFTVERGGENLIVTRDKDGAVHAFFNVCRHRGSRICDAGPDIFKARFSARTMPGRTDWTVT